MAFCGKCGTEIKNKDTSFCPNCGTSINIDSFGETTIIKKTKSKKGKIILSSISILIVIAIVSIVVIIKPFDNDLDSKGSTNTVESKNDWYMTESSIVNYRDGEKVYESSCKYLPNGNGQYLERIINGDVTTYTYDKSNHLLAMCTPDYNFNFNYIEKGSKYVGQSNIARVDNNTCYMIVKYDRNNRLVLMETYYNDKIESSIEYSYVNGILNKVINIYNDSYNITSFDDKGQTVAIELFDSNDKLSEKIVYEYKDNLNIGRKMYNGKGELIGSEVNGAIENGIMISVAYNDNNEKTGYTEYLYDNYGNVIETKIYGEDNVLVQHTTNTWRLNN